MTQTPNQDPAEERNMTLIEHLTDLRVCLTKSAYAIFFGTIAAWTISQHVFDIIRAPIAPYLPNGGLVYTGPIDKFMAHVKISFIVGMILSAPFWLYQIWKFISPALYQKEKRFAVGFIAFGTTQFLLGIAFSYYVVLPMAFKFLMHFGGDIDKPMITIDQYLGFFTQTALVFGLTFEMPVIITFLGMMGLVSKNFLKEKRKYAVVAITGVSAIAAPPDALSMVLLMIPLWVMYEISIVLVGFFEKGKVESV